MKWAQKGLIDCFRMNAELGPPERLSGVSPRVWRLGRLGRRLPRQQHPATSARRRTTYRRVPALGNYAEELG